MPNSASPSTVLDLDYCRGLDAQDPLAPVRERFSLPGSLAYFDGNSLGPVPHAVRERVGQVVEREWGRDLIGSWNAHDWIGLPRRVGAKIAPLVGAAPGQVVACDSVSVNLFKLLAAALRLRPGRRTILCQEDHFPTDLYMAQGLADLLGGDFEVRRAPVDDLAEALDESVAVMSVGHVDFREGRLLDMDGLTRAAHTHGALALWDLSHSAGALAVELDACEVDLAVGCGYKFLNGGPGAPAFLYVAQRHHESVETPLPGWLGHRRPFDFASEYEPAPGVDRFVCGTPPILALSALDAALDAWDGVDLARVRDKSRRQGDLLLALVRQQCDAWIADGSLGVASTGDSADRGSQISLRHPHGYAIMQALIARGVVGDFRAPDILRFGLCPLYLRYEDLWTAVTALREVLESDEYRESRFSRRGRVT